MEGMLCKTCTHCGLCPGDGTFRADKNLMISSEGISSPLRKDPSLPSFYTGIAMDIGTTTVAAKAYRLCNAEVLAEYKEANFQQKFGSDVIARISFATEADGYKKIREATLLQIEKAVKKLLGEVAFLFTSQRCGRPYLARLVITGNTAMQSFAAGLSVKGLSTFPFVCDYLFGEEKPASDFFAGASFLSADCPVYFTPAQSAFIGGDTISAMMACGFADKNIIEEKSVKILADVGTNCEMALLDGRGNVWCTSSAAGPAFEGYGISQGMNACEGAVAKVSLVQEEKPGVRAGGKLKFLCSVIGGGSARGICGTGLLSAISLFYKTGLINQNGTLLRGRDSVSLCKGVSLCQKDIRNFQLAKAAVLSGIESLIERAGLSVQKCSSDAALYLAGGFGTKLDQKDACLTGMIPSFLEGSVVHAGNAALGGASMLLFDENLRKDALLLARKAKNINLAQDEGFQARYIKALNFPDLP
ncbi:MAG: DUF4445 domain-containing protein [Treponema sp.]|nr:DUF4445 domain-containing protein [Treponema sp.]